jgi:hypothetical protein
MNLDSMTAEELIKFHNETKAHPVKFARANFAGKPGAVAAARDLANYAINLAVSLELRAENKIERADMYLEICQNIRQNFLPEYALPYLGTV